MDWMVSDGWVYGVVMVAVCWFAYRVGKGTSEAEATKEWAAQSSVTTAQHQRIKKLKAMLGEEA
ncbi:hypothetical protein [Brevundimonas sp.]|uniref:hypothetical protein n=1 Tax=Brevundimonas sp. TaxID=1871086 RepID=UPI0028B1EABE|nr:hypothetical protein [Brevundimonas sp.]